MALAGFCFVLCFLFIFNNPISHAADSNHLPVEATPSSSSSSSSSSSDESLIWTLIVHRHGDRSPIKVNPRDREKWHSKNLVPGELTSIGEQQLRALGRSLRNRLIIESESSPSSSSSFPHLLPAQYEPNTMLVRSTNVPRCLSSAQFLLDELYPGAHIPIKAVTQDIDTLLQPTDKCPSYVSSYNRVAHALSETLDDQYADLIASLNRVTGWITDTHKHKSAKENHVHRHDDDDHDVDASRPRHRRPPPHSSISSSASMIATVYDNIACMNAHRFPLPAPLSTHERTLESLTKKLYYERFVSKATIESPYTDARGTIGALLLDDIIRIMKLQSGWFSRSGEKHKEKGEYPSSVSEEGAGNIVSDLQNSENVHRRRWSDFAVNTHEKLRIYSAHDSTIIALMSALMLIRDDTSQYLLPPYAASVQFELTKTNNDEYYVSLYYGYPIPPSSNPEDASSLLWEYDRVPVNDLPCPIQSSLDRRASKCPLNQFIEFANIMKQTKKESAPLGIQRILGSKESAPQMNGDIDENDGSDVVSDMQWSAHGYGVGDGCCVRTPDFELLSCHSYSSSYQDLNEECKLWRRLCPHTACSNNQVIDLATLTCRDVQHTNPISQSVSYASLSFSESPGSWSVSSITCLCFGMVFALGFGVFLGTYFQKQSKPPLAEFAKRVKKYGPEE